MNGKFWKTFVVALITFVVLDFLVNGLLMKSTYESESVKALMRPEAEMKMWLFIVVDVIIVFFMTLIFSKGYEGKGVSEGARYGLFIGLLMSIPMAYGTYAAMPIPYYMALQWFLYGTVQFVITGCVLAAVWGKQAVVQKIAA
jgi:hypothetical protein